MTTMFGVLHRRCRRALRRPMRLARAFCYALARAATARDACKLIVQTCRFHFHNHRRTGPLAMEEPFQVQLGLVDQPVQIGLRALAGDLFILYEIFLDRVYHIPSSVLPRDDVRLVIDCGANIGLAALFLAGQYPKATVLAVEPHPDNYALLKSNTAHEPRITPIHACIVGVNGGDRFISIDRPAWGNTTSQSGNGVAVPAKTIDELLVDHSGERIDLLKVDIEGAERELFADANFLRRTRMVIIELHGNYGMDEFERDLAPFQFKAHAPDESIGMITARPISQVEPRPSPVS